MVINGQLYKNSIGYLLIVVLAVVFFYPIFKPGYLVRLDNPTHHFEIDFLAKQILPDYEWFNGWCHQDYLGSPISLYRPQAGPRLILTINKLFSLSLIGAYKIALLLSFIVFGCGMFFLIAGRFGRIAGIITTFSMMLQKDIYYDKILGGMWENYLALGIFLIFLNLLFKYRCSLTLKKALILGVVLAVIVLSHPLSAIFAFFVLLFAFLISMLDKKENTHINLYLYLLIPLVSFTVSFYYIFPFLETGQMLNSLASPKSLIVAISWPIKGLLGGFERFFSLQQFLSGEYLVFLKGLIKSFFVNYPLIVRDIFGIFGIWLFYKHRSLDYAEKKFLQVVSVFTVFSLVYYSDLLLFIPLWKYVPFVSKFESHRFLTYSHLGLLIFCAYGLSEFLRRVKKSVRKLILMSMFVFFIGSFAAHKGLYVKEGTKTFDQLEASRSLKDLWSWVSLNVDPYNSRIVYQNTLGNSKDTDLAKSHIFSLAGIYTNVFQIGGEAGAAYSPTEKICRTDKKAIFGESIYAINDIKIANWMNFLNSRFIVSSESVLEEKLAESYLFTQEKQFGSFSIFKLKYFTSARAEFKEQNTNFKWVEFKNHSLQLDIENNNVNNWVRIKVSNHPYWKAYLNKLLVPIESDEYGLMRIPLKDIGVFRLHIGYNSKKKAPVVVSLLSLSLVFLGLILPDKRGYA